MNERQPVSSVLRSGHIKRLTQREELYRRLEQVRRHVGCANDDLTKERIATHAADLEQQLAEAEANDTDAPPT